MNNNLVREGYNRIARAYLENRGNFNNVAYLELLSSIIPPHSLILDCGCGAGAPIDKYFIEHNYRVLGIDISEQQISLARQNVPQATYEVKDISKLQNEEYKVDALISFYVLYHLSRDTHQELLRVFRSFLHAGSYLFVLTGSKDLEGFENDFYGSQMYWSQYGSKKNSEMVEKAGFKIIFNEEDSTAGEKHQAILAQRLD